MPRSPAGQTQSSSRAVKKSEKSWFTLPAPIRAVFDTFPLVTYEANPFPQRCSLPSNIHTLYIWTISTSNDGRILSPNPGCLKWQAYLLSQKVPFQVVSSNNHASPSGALPFVMPAMKGNMRSAPISSSKISRWSEEVTRQPSKSMSLQLTAYLALIDQNIRNAWLFHLYLVQENFDHVAAAIYIDPKSSNLLVRTKSKYELQRAAKELILKTSTNIDQEEIYGAADAAFAALSTQLAQKELFSEDKRPDEFDVSLFAYTHPLLDLEENQPSWRDRKLLDLLLKHDRLVQHRNTVLNKCTQ